MLSDVAPWESFAAAAVTAVVAAIAAIVQGRKTRTDNAATRELNTHEHEHNSRKLDRIVDAIEDVADTTRSHSRRLDRIDARIDRITERKETDDRLDS